MVNNLHIAIGIIGFLSFVGLLMPLLQAEFNLKTVTYDLNTVDDSLNPELNDGISGTDVESLSIIGSLFTMFFWTYSFLPAWIQLGFVVIRIALLLILVTYIPVLNVGRG